ncbi:UPF0223 family protein [Jeotgalibacillus campisalis]|uniref:Uncharacterized protein n=1 Tax=Jeotgalibacillus campisalis TaxID=220754 RepID=A0A0C2VT10_9BACL|nr:UPF0223 family protein [Jeotgalibacillus campisalis]KIL47561.1 hypothetical protein KR50_17280 [Jeotgalibacillus campisalis]
MELQYPLSIDWTTEEIIDVMKFYELVEKTHISHVNKSDFMAAYRRFKEIVPSKSEEKSIDKEFKESSGYSIYQAVKKAKNTDDGGNISI